MTRNNFSKNFKLKSLLILLLLLVMSFSLALATACDSDEDNASKDPTYSYTDVDEGLIKNGTFSLGTTETKLNAFPKTSTTGWTKSSNADVATASKTGVVDVKDVAWKELMKNLYSDSGTLNFIKAVNNITDADVKAAIKQEKGDDSYTPTSSDIKDYIIENYYNSFFVNPGKYSSDVTDTKVYMMNNYTSRSYIGKGSAQRITSTTSLTLNKDSVVKISVWVKTLNLVSQNKNDNGAFVMLSNIINGVNKAPVAITNITDTEWTEYSFYVKSDDFYNCQVTLVLGLGYDNDSATQGTAFFDGVTVEYIDDASVFNTTEAKLLNFDETDETTIKASTSKIAYYDMTLDSFVDKKVSTYYSNLEVNSLTGKLTEYETGYTQPATASTTYQINDGVITYTLKDVSYTIKLDSSDFKVKNESYVYVQFDIKNDLSKFGYTDISVSLYDIFGSSTELRGNIATIPSTDDEWTQCGILVKNNFITGADRSFYLEILIGPSAEDSLTYATDFATGNVSIKNIQFSKGSTIEPEKGVTNYEALKINYSLYEMLATSANGSSSLYAGGNDYSEETDTNTYSFTASPSDIGVITSKPANVSNYTGISSKHFYINENNTEMTVNSKKTAGVISTKHIDKYTTLPGVKSALNFSSTAEEQNIQPIVIYNPTADSYGFIGDNTTIASSSSVKVSVTVRTYGDASAYVYLVDTSDKVKDVLTFDSFTDNDGNEINGSNKKFMLKVNENVMDGDDWVTLNFYLATGATSKEFRVEVWNGSRDGQNKSQGYVFVKDIEVVTTSAFNEPTKTSEAFYANDDGSPLYDAYLYDSSIKDNAILYTQQLTDLEKKFNSEQKTSDTKVSYDAKYVWANSSNTIYAIFNSIDPVEVDPYKNAQDDSNDSDNTTTTDPSTLWMSLSSLLLGIAIVLALIALIVKRVRAKRRANANDAKTHYTVTSRAKLAEKARKVKEKAVAEDVEEIEEITQEQPVEEIQEVVEETETETEQTLDEYVYGEVQDFGQEDSQNQNDEQ